MRRFRRQAGASSISPSGTHPSPQPPGSQGGQGGTRARGHSRREHDEGTTVAARGGGHGGQRARRRRGVSTDQASGCAQAPRAPLAPQPRPSSPLPFPPPPSGVPRPSFSAVPQSGSGLRRHRRTAHRFGPARSPSTPPLARRSQSSRHTADFCGFAEHAHQHQSDHDTTVGPRPGDQTTSSSVRPTPAHPISLSSPIPDFPSFLLLIIITIIPSRRLFCSACFLDPPSPLNPFHPSTIDHLHHTTPSTPAC